MTNPNLIPADMRKRAEKLRRKATTLDASAGLWETSSVAQAATVANILRGQATEIRIIADQIDAWANGLE